MSDKKAEGGKPEGEAKAPAGEADHKSSGGVKAWLPLMATIVIMPVLAFLTTKFLVLPKVVQARGPAEETGHESAGGFRSDDHKDPVDQGKPKEAKESKGTAKKKQTVAITKVIVNVAGTMGARYLMASFTLAGTQADFKTIIEENRDQLLDLANTAMASKTITELEKPGARNQLRAELMSIFNNVLGSGVIQEIYFTEFAVQ
jgi:flagellar FliL protein